MSSEYSPATVLKNWDASLKIPAFFILMMSMAFIRKTVLLPVLPAIASVLFILSGLPFPLLLSRFRAPAYILLFVSVFLMLFSGDEILFQAGPVALKLQGTVTALTAWLRVLSVITVGTVMVHTTQLSGLSEKLKRTGIPRILVDIGIMTGRYIMVIGEDYNQMKTARKLRGYVPGKSLTRRFGVIIPTAATLLIKGFQQSEMVFNAMCMRGYGNDIRESKISSEKHSKAGIIMFCVITAVSVFLIVLEVAVETS